MRHDSERRTFSIDRDREAAGPCCGGTRSVLADLRGRECTVAVGIHCLAFLERGNFRHVNHAIELYPVGTDVDAGEMIDGEVSKRMSGGYGRSTSEDNQCDQPPPTAQRKPVHDAPAAFLGIVMVRKPSLANAACRGSNCGLSAR